MGAPLRGVKLGVLDRKYESLFPHVGYQSRESRPRVTDSQMLDMLPLPGQVNGTDRRAGSNTAEQLFIDISRVD